MRIFQPKNTSLFSTRCVNLLVKILSLRSCTVSVTNGGNYDFPAIRMDYGKTFKDDIFSQKVCLYLLEEIPSVKLKDIMETLSVKHNFNPRAKFIISGTLFTMEMRKVLKEFYVLDVIFIHLNTGFIHRFIPSTLGVYDTGMCTRMTISQLVQAKVGNSSEKNELSLLYLKSFVYAMCTTCDKPGIEIEIIRVILRNAKIESSFNEIEPTDQEYRSMWKNHDILFGTLVIAFTVPGLEITMPYVFDEAAFFIPLSFDIPRWKYILTALPCHVWISWFLLSIIMSLLWVLTRKVDGNADFQEFSTIFSYSLVFFIEQSLRLRTELLSRKILLVGILLLSFNMNMFFKSRFTYLLDGVNHVDSAESLREIMRKRLDIGVSTRYIADFLNSTPEVRHYIQEHMVDCISEKLDDCIERAITKRDMVILYPAKKVRGKKRLFSDRFTGLPLLEQLKPSVASMPISLAFPRGHPALSFFNKNLIRLREHGIVDMISRKYEESWPEQEGTFLRVAKPLNFEHMVGPAFIWGLGCFLSVLLFLNELYAFVRF